MMCDDWVDKIWGRTKEIIHTPYYSKHELEVQSGSYCSLHYHKHRSNVFQIVSATIEIVEMYGPLVVKTKLGPDNSCVIASLVPHMFIVYKDGIVIEEYFPDRGGAVQRDDIVRLYEGGRMDVDKLNLLPQCLFISTPNS